jgi:hypothetical protein
MLIYNVEYTEYAKIVKMFYKLDALTKQKPVMGKFNELSKIFINENLSNIPYHQSLSEILKKAIMFKFEEPVDDTTDKINKLTNGLHILNNQIILLKKLKQGTDVILKKMNEVDLLQKKIDSITKLKKNSAINYNALAKKMLNILADGGNKGKLLFILIKDELCPKAVQEYNDVPKHEHYKTQQKYNDNKFDNKYNDNKFNNNQKQSGFVPKNKISMPQTNIFDSSLYSPIVEKDIVVDIDKSKIKKPTGLWANVSEDVLEAPTEEIKTIVTPIYIDKSEMDDPIDKKPKQYNSDGETISDYEDDLDEEQPMTKGYYKKKIVEVDADGFVTITKTIVTLNNDEFEEDNYDDDEYDDEYDEECDDEKKEYKNKEQEYNDYVEEQYYYNSKNMKLDSLLEKFSL